MVNPLQAASRRHGHDTASVQLQRISARMKVISGTGFKLQMTRGLRTAAKPLIVDVQAAARRQLPHGGGLNEQVAGQKITVSVRTGARTAGVRLVTRAPDTSQTDQGFVRHPTYGRRGKGDWKRQEIPNAAGWWSQTLANDAHKVTPALIAVLTAVEAEIQRGI